MTYRCNKCKDTGWILKEVNGYMTGFSCECRKRLIYGRKYPTREYTFDAHKNDPEYHKDLRGGNNG